MQQKRHTVGAELHVALKHAVAVLRTQPKRGQRVLRGQLACAPVGDPAWVGPAEGCVSGVGQVASGSWVISFACGALVSTRKASE
jgi:hypothetical protein